MIIALGFLAPLLIYCVLFRRFPNARLMPFVLAAAVAIWSAVAVIVVISFSPHWPDGTQIAWTGVETSGRTIRIGGPREQSVVGWPSGAFKPALEVTNLGDGGAALSISGGRAFVFDDRRGSFVNGLVVPLGASQAFGNFRISVKRRWLFWQRIEILDGSGRVLVKFTLPLWLARRSRAYSMLDRVERNAADLRSDMATLLQVEEWARDLSVLVTSAGEIRILDLEPSTFQCKLPCALSIYWPQERLAIEIRQSPNGFALDFLPPWRRASPIPPQSADKQARLIVTGRSRPGDRAFLLPFGHGIADPRREFSLTRKDDEPPVFASGRRIDPSDEYLPPPVVDGSARRAVIKGVTSEVTVPSEDLSFRLATVNDLPDRKKLAGWMTLALACLLLGLSLCYPRLPDGITAWTLCGIVAVLWTFLAFRFLLALRYSLELGRLDFLVVKGVTVSLCGLVVIPGLILLIARLRRDIFARPESRSALKRWFRLCAGYLTLLFGAFFYAYYCAPGLWLNVPDRLVPSLGFSFATAVVLVFCYGLAGMFLLYNARIGSIGPILRTVFLGPLGWLETCQSYGQHLWQQLATAGRLRMVPFLGASLAAAAAFLFAPFVLSLLPFNDLPQEVIIPFLICWPMVLFWLSSRGCFPPGGTRVCPRWTILALCAVLTIFFPVFFLPPAMRDTGSILATLALFVPVLGLLLIAAPRRFGLAGFASVGFALALAGILYVNLIFILPYLNRFSDTTAARMLSFKEGSAVQSYMLFADVDGEGSGGLSLQKLRDGHQHTWENRAIAHEGGPWGLGFGNAPARRSHVRQDTIQYDSTYSFFISGDYGLVGGISLLLMYLVPLALVVLGGRPRFDFGYGVAFVAAGSFFLEACLHAGMNLGVVFFTGRNLPLLGVNSISDLWRWTILFTLTGLGLFSRYRGRGEIRPDSVSFAPPMRGGGASAAVHYRRFALKLAVVPALLLLLILIAGIEVVFDKKLDKPFSWDQILTTVDRMAGDGRLRAKADRTIEVDESLRISDGDLIKQEIDRFNLLPEEERAGDGEAAALVAKLRGVAGFSEYQQALDQVRKQDSPTKRRPSLFMLTRREDWHDPDSSREFPGYSVKANPESNVHLSFKAPPDPADLPSVLLRDGKTMLIGPAWEMGRWTQTFDAGIPLPWTAHLAREVGDLGRELSRRYRTLSLDRSLHTSAVSFSGRVGRLLCDRSFGERAAGARLSFPRVALSVLTLPGGEVVALGSWPRTTSDHVWRKSRAGEEWLPPLDWVEQDAPRSLRLYYGGDRNFDRIVAGSATKPIWASAVLAVHPNLNRQLQVKGEDQRESDVFGIQLSRSWQVSPAAWRDFTGYLAESDNRYQARLGFLGLANQAGADVVDAGQSPSVKESLAGAIPSPWRKFPEFPLEIRFSPRNEAFANLHQTPLADRFRKMFSIGIESGSRHRLSFWTGDEADDLLSQNQETPFKGISPHAVNLELNTITNPGDYISLLFGGGTNLWSNIDLAAAFGTCVTGVPVVPNIVHGQEPAKPGADRESFPEIAAKLRPGLAAVITSGTANARLRNTGALDFLRGLKAYKVYAKTGTLKPDDDGRDTSRILLAIVRWGNERKGIATNGLVFSLIGEKASMGAATEWLGRFLVENQADIRRLLAEKPSR
ncbi:MAG: hypothetical protein ACR2L2_06320 [Acidobacteriota bacterium]